MPFTMVGCPQDEAWRPSITVTQILLGIQVEKLDRAPFQTHPTPPQLFPVLKATCARL